MPALRSEAVKNKGEWMATKHLSLTHQVRGIKEARAFLQAPHKAQYMLFTFISSAHRWLPGWAA